VENSNEVNLVLNLHSAKRVGVRIPPTMPLRPRV